nr:enoyl-CoA delta isomerase 2, peroxisomal-like [Ipomoea batatas]
MCTLEKRGDIFYLTLTGDGEHRLNPDLITTLGAALADVKSQAVRGSVLITKAEGNFFSNGFDLKYAKAAGSPEAAADRLHHMVEMFKPIVAELISLPMPTIAAVTGHAAAAGLMLAISHDYVTMRSDKGVLYMSELDIGLPLPDYFTALIGSKIAETLSKRRWEGKNYAVIRKSLLPDACTVLKCYESLLELKILQFLQAEAEGYEFMYAIQPKESPVDYQLMQTQQQLQLPQFAALQLQASSPFQYIQILPQSELLYRSSSLDWFSNQAPNFYSLPISLPGNPSLYLEIGSEEWKKWQASYQEG